MRATRRFWVSGGTAASLIALGVVLERPSLAVGGLVVAGWLLAHQVAFVLRVQTLLDEATIGHEVTPSQTVSSQPVRLQTTVTTPDGPGPLQSVSVDTPAGTTPESSTSARATGPETTIGVLFRPTVAGRYAIDPPTLSLRDDRGLFEQTLQRGTGATLQVDPDAPRNVHVGTGGQRYVAGIGEHDAAIGRSGIEPGELREYVPGDPQNRIDWKATARRGEPHVREYESSSERRTLLFVDHSESTGRGRDGHRRLDYLREVAVWLLRRARQRSDPVGLVTVGDDGITGRFEAAADSEHYRRLELALYDLEPTAKTTANATARETDRLRTTADLLDDDSTFARTLRPYVEEATTYVDTVGAAPLFSAADVTLGSTPGDPWAVLLTDDDDRPELVETVRHARRRGGYATAFVTPGVAFGPQGLQAVETVYDDYLDFESFRQRLVALGRSEAYEVAPDETLQAVLQQRPEVTG
ncbi:DUF58 domain-containing protein [Haloarchaeobius sp. HRN-SO-5]|uniref:DUF58 domain-containing protein n=1 Tax=Haloarchaeobius sp. HRN-SO-5 TaxID=3446118 RepID=UPI003EBE7201